MALIEALDRESLRNIVRSAFALQMEGIAAPSPAQLRELMEDVFSLSAQVLQQFLPFMLLKLTEYRRRPKSVAFTILEVWLIDHVLENGLSDAALKLTTAQRAAVASVLEGTAPLYESVGAIGYELSARKWRHS